MKRISVISLLVIMCFGLFCVMGCNLKKNPKTVDINDTNSAIVEK